LDFLGETCNLVLATTGRRPKYKKQRFQMIANNPCVPALKPALSTESKPAEMLLF